MLEYGAIESDVQGTCHNEATILCPRVVFGGTMLTLAQLRSEQNSSEQQTTSAHSTYTCSIYCYHMQIQCTSYTFQDNN